MAILYGNDITEHVECRQIEIKQGVTRNIRFLRTKIKIVIILDKYFIIIPNDIHFDDKHVQLNGRYK